MGERSKGLYQKYEVERVDGRDQEGGDRESAEYYVLDIAHDPHALPALAAYAEAVEADGYHALAHDLRARLDARR